MSQFGVNDSVKSDRMYEALEQLALETEAGSVKDAIVEYMTTAPLESFVRFYDILTNIGNR